MVSGILLYFGRPGHYGILEDGIREHSPLSRLEKQSSSTLDPTLCWDDSLEPPRPNDSQAPRWIQKVDPPRGLVIYAI